MAKGDYAGCALAKTFSDHLVSQMAWRGWSMKEMARRTGLGEATIRAIRDLRSTPNLSSVQRIADAFRLPPQALLTPPAVR